MTFHLIHDDGHSLLAADRPIVKARDAAAFPHAADLLTALRDVNAQAEARCHAAERAARERGLSEGREAGQAAFLKAVTDLTLQAREDRLAQEQQIADLALAALRRMVEDIGEEAMLIGAARRAVASVLPAEDVAVHVAPALADLLGEALAQDERTSAVTVRPDPELMPQQCRVTTSAGRVIADLDRQIAAIEDRWSTPHVD